MPRRLITQPVAYTVVGTMAAATFSAGVTDIALWLAGIPLPV